VLKEGNRIETLTVHNARLVYAAIYVIFEKTDDGNPFGEINSYEIKNNL